MERTEFEATPDEQGNIRLPEQLIAKLAGQSVKVTIAYPAEDQPDADADTHYTKGYDQKDSLYDAY